MSAGTEVAVANQGGGLVLRDDQVDWSPDQRAAFDQIGIADAPPGDQKVFLHVARRSGLDPFARQIYMISRWDPQAQKNKWTIQTAIDGYRVIADRRDEYGGQRKPEWCGEDGVWHDAWTGKEPPVAARVAVIRKDWDEPAWGVAHFWEFAATKRDGNLNQMWATKGRHQIAKCAEAAALRKAFPQDFAGIYTEEEMEHLDNPAAPRVIIDSEREPVTAPDWDALIVQAVDARDVDKLRKVWDMAKGMFPNDRDLFEKIAQAGERIKNGASSADPTAGDPAPDDTPSAERTQKNRLFALLRDGGVEGAQRPLRLRIVNRILAIENRAPASPVTSFDHLGADDIEAVNTFLQDHKNAGDLVHTLAELGSTPESPSDNTTKDNQ